MVRKHLHTTSKDSITRSISEGILTFIKKYLCRFGSIVLWCIVTTYDVKDSVICFVQFIIILAWKQLKEVRIRGCYVKVAFSRNHCTANLTWTTFCIKFLSKVEFLLLGTNFHHEKVVNVTSFHEHLYMICLLFSL